MDRLFNIRKCDIRLTCALLTLLTFLILMIFQAEISRWVLANFIIRAPLVLVGVTYFLSLMIYITLSSIGERVSENTSRKEKQTKSEQKVTPRANLKSNLRNIIL